MKALRFVIFLFAVIGVLLGVILELLIGLTFCWCKFGQSKLKDSLGFIKSLF